MKYLHAMIRVHDLDATCKFFTAGLGLVETRRFDVEAGRFTLVPAGPAGPAGGAPAGPGGEGGAGIATGVTAGTGGPG